MKGALAAVTAMALFAVPGAGGSEAAKPRSGGAVVVMQPFGQSEPECFSPAPPCSTVLSNALITIPGYEPIVGQVLEGAFEIAPDLTYRPNLVSHVTVRKRPFTLTYHIRRDARWADGPPVTARDFAFTYKLLLFVYELRGATPPGPEDPLWAIRAVRALDAKTVGVSFNSPVAAWRELFRRVYPRHALAGRDPRSVWRDGIVNPKTGRPTGSGPFLVQRWERGRELILVRNRRWKPRRAYLDRIVFRYPGDLAPDRFPAGVNLFETYRNIPRALGHETRATPGPTWEHIAIQLGPKGHPALDNRLVRRALALGINRAALLSRLSFGRYTRPLDNGILLANSRFYERHWHVYRHRPSEARRLLEQAGCSRGSDGIYSCGGRRLSLRLAARGFGSRGSSEIEGTGIATLREQLRGIGVELVPFFSEPQAFFDTVLPGGDFDLALSSLIGGPEPGAAVEIWRCGGRRNVTGYCNRQVSRELLRSQREVDQTARMKLLNRADAMLARDVPFIPLYQQPWFVSHGPSLRGVVNNPWEGFTWNSENWWLAR